MRYNRENTSEMITRLGYLMDCFTAAVDKKSDQVYVGPKVDDARLLRAQDFVRTENAPQYVSQITRDLFSHAYKTGELATVTPHLTAAAAKLKDIGFKKEDQFLGQIMEYAV